MESLHEAGFDPKGCLERLKTITSNENEIPEASKTRWELAGLKLIRDKYSLRSGTTFDCRPETVFP